MATTTVRAVVLTHNRPDSAIRCVRSILGQRSVKCGALLFDNASSVAARDQLRGAGLLGDPRVTYLCSGRNLGSSGGFRTAMEAARRGAEWLWVLDDDTEADGDALKWLLARTAGRGVVAVAGKKLWRDGAEQSHHCGRFSRWTGFCPLPAGSPGGEVDYSAFTGMLVSTAALDLVGYPRSDFFIWSDDMEFCFRLRTQGSLIFEPRAVFWHDEPRAAGGSRWAHRTDLDGYWKRLCGFRNYEYLMRRHAIGGVVRSPFRLARKLAKVLLVEDEKAFRAKWLIRYYLDSYRSEFHNVEPDEWRRMAAAIRRNG